MNSAEETSETLHYNRLCSQWGPPEAHIRMAEIRQKTPEDLEAWEASCRGRAAYALGRANGDGFWEAKVTWYGTRANWLKAMRNPSSPMNTSPTLRKRPVGEIRPMNPAPKRREITPGGWPSGRPASYHGPTPSGSPTGEAEGTSLPPEHPSPSPSEPVDSLALIKESY